MNISEIFSRRYTNKNTNSGDKIDTDFFASKEFKSRN